MDSTTGKNICHSENDKLNYGETNLGQEGHEESSNTTLLPLGNYDSSNSSINKYLNEIKKYKLLDANEETALSEKIKKGDRKSINKLVNSNLRFVISVAKTYAGEGGTRLEDLINEGNMGLVEAAQDFDPSTGFKFISYAIWHIKKNILKHLSNQARTVRVPQNGITAIRRLRQIEDRLASELGRMPLESELMERYEMQERQEGRGEMSRQRIQGIRRAVGADEYSILLDRPVGRDRDDETAPIDYLDAEPMGIDLGLIQGSAREFIERQLGKLSEENQEIVKAYWGIDRTFPESLTSIAGRMGCTSEKIRLRLRKSLEKMQFDVRRQGLQMDHVL